MEDKHEKGREPAMSSSVHSQKNTNIHHTYGKNASHYAKKAKWEEIKKYHAEKKILKSVVANVVKDGLIVRFLGWSAYLHKSYVPTSLYEKTEKGSTIEVVITKIQETEEGNRIWVSSKLAISIKRDKIKNYPIGASVVGSIIAVRNNGIIIFVEAGTTGWISTSESTLAEIADLGITLKKKEQLHLIVDDNTKSLLLKLDYEYYKNKLERTKKRSQQEKDYKLFIENLQPGISIHRAIVTGINKGYVEISVDGHLGYIEKEDLSWEWVKNPADEVFLGETIEVLFDEEKNGKLYFSLKWQDVKLYVDEYYTANTDTLLNVLGITKNEFVGKIIPFKDKTLAVSVMAISEDDYGKLLVDPFTGKNLTVEVPERYELTPQDYYAFSLTVSSEEERRNRQQPFSFDIYQESAAIPLENPYKKEVERNFRLNDNPKSNRETARLLKEIGADMYADRDRMFYELLQNADDAAPMKGVQIKIQVKGKYLIFTHNGLPFSLADFKSINSAANSTKPRDSKKTGYKGIGFKSVFTDAQEVYIRTGGFSFKYDRGSELFENFEKFYSSVYDGDFAIFNEKFKEYRSDFHKVDDLPWQMLPFWVDNLPNELQNTLIEQYHNVSIALKIGDRAKLYEDKIYKIIISSKFMLFLRNTNRIQLEHEGKLISLAVERRDGNIVELKNSLDKVYQSNLYYLNKKGCEIDTTNKNFINCNIPIKKTCQQVGDREKWSLYEITNIGEIQITSVPERIIEENSTTISYAFKYEEGKGVVSIPQNALSLYAYLPMEDRRYVLPFFVNADFELSSNRQEAKRNAKWNQFIFYNIGRKLCEWVGEVATEENTEYLSLIPSHWFSEILDDEKEDFLAKDFNRGFKESLMTVPFVLNDKCEVVRQCDIIIDKSGLSGVVGNDAFCMLLETEKRPPHPSINSVYLDNHEIFEHVEKYSFDLVRDSILSKKNLKRILTYWNNARCETKNSVFRWLSVHAQTDEKLASSLSRIPAFNIHGKWYSYSEIEKKNHLCVLNTTTQAVKDILEKIGLQCSDYNISSHPLSVLLYAEPKQYDSLLFKKIVNACAKKAGALTVEEKHRLFKQYKHPLSGIDDRKMAKWVLFSNRHGDLCPLANLTNIDSAQYNNVIDFFSIDEKEYREELDSYLIAPQDIFQTVAFDKWDELTAVAGDDERKVLSLYKFVIDRYNEACQRKAEEIEQCDFKYKKIIFANGTMRDSESCFINLSVSMQDEARNLVNLLSNRWVPTSNVIGYVKQKPFSCKEDTFACLMLKNPVELSKEQVITLFNLCIQTSDSILNKNWIRRDEDKYVLEPLSKNECLGYTDDMGLVKAICSWYPDIKLIPSEFESYIDLDGVNTDNNLLQRIIETDHDLDGHVDFLIDYIEHSSSDVKKLFVEKLSSLCLSPATIRNDGDCAYRILSIVDRLDKSSQGFLDELRRKISILTEEGEVLLTSVEAQRTIRVDGVEFPISRLLPDNDKQAASVGTIVEKLRTRGISQKLINNIFKLEYNAKYVDQIFNQLDSKDFVVKSSCQLAFVIMYANSKKIPRLQCKIETGTGNIGENHPIQNVWYYKLPSFVKKNHVLPAQYDELELYLKLPFQSSDIIITKDFSDFNHLKDALTEGEQKELMSYVYAKWKESHLPIDAGNLQIIKHALSLKECMIGAENEYLLPNEVIPAHVQFWLSQKNTKRRCEFANSILKIPNDSCPLIRIRKYLNGKCLWDKENNLTEIMQGQLCDWMAQKRVSLDTYQYLNITSILSNDYFLVEVNQQQLECYKSVENILFRFKNYVIYDCKESIPFCAKLTKNSGYIFHDYQEGNVWKIEDSIYVNGNCISVDEALKELTTLGKLTADDYFAYVQAPKDPEYTAQLEGGIDNDLDEKRRIARSSLAKSEVKKWLMEHGYTIPDNLESYTCFETKDSKGKTYPIVIKSLTDDLFVNPTEWFQLMRQNSRLILYLRHGEIAVINREQLLKSRDFMFLRISVENFEPNESLKEKLNQISNCLQYFQRTHIVFKELRSNTRFRASNSLDDIGLYDYSENFSTTEDNLQDL